MIKLLTILLLIQGILMGANLEYIEVKDTKIPLIHEKDGTLPIQSMQLVFVGGGNLFAHKNGLSRFSAKILSEGTKTLGATAFANELEKYAISLSANSGNETFVVELTALKEYFDKGLGLTKELFTDPNITQKSMQKVATNYTGELYQRETNYDYLANRELKGLLYEGTLASYTKPQDIDKINAEDVKKFLKDTLTLENVIVLTGGDMSAESAKEKAVDFLTIFAKGEKFSLPYYRAEKNADTKIQHKQSDQAYIYFIAPFTQLEPKQQYKAKLASFILGSSGFGSRLMEEIRVKRGLAYSVHANITTNKTHSYFSGHLQTKIDSADEAIEVIEELIGEFIQKGVTKKELEDAKKFLQGSDPLRRETLMQRISIAFMEHYKGLPLGYSHTQLQDIADISLSELNAFIKDHAEIADLRYSIVTAKE
ncbi:MAG: M16 family metallopeptidase [Campylobacterota bacterium]